MRWTIGLRTILMRNYCPICQMYMVDGRGQPAEIGECDTCRGSLIESPKRQPSWPFPAGKPRQLTQAEQAAANVKGIDDAKY